ncbi:MAG: redoxin domain-containing protein [Pirellulales bacterium]|nr:redoxin domain-containing protein [Pirellulales bacterium]
MRLQGLRYLAVAAALLAVLAVLAGTTATARAAEETRIGTEIKDFKLDDFHGNEHILSDFDDSKLLVVAFVGVECPLAKLYAPRLEELSKEFSDKGVAFVMIDSNQQDSITELSAFARIHGVTFPVLKDLDNVVADQFGAVRTPEVFVLDENRAIRYRGRVDDQYGLGSSSGYARPEVKRRDLGIAIEELLEGRAVSEPVTEAVGCFIGRVSRVTPHGDVTYANQIARIFQNRCIECHREGEVAPFTLKDYDEIVGWAPTIREVVSDGRMPPWFADPAHGEFKNDARLTDEEKQQIFTWIDNGCPEGDKADLPEPRHFTDGWKIPEPDAVFYMADEAYDVPAEGVVEYQYFEVDLGFTEDKWIRVAEARPGNRAVVHHIICFVQPPGGKASGFSENRSGLAGYAPGMPPASFPEGVAMFVKAGSKLIFQLHYTPNGSPQQDRSYVGMCFIDAKDVKKKASGGVAGNLGFKIPPGDNNYEVKAKRKFRRDTLLVSMTPHMHLRGKSFRYEATYPDGTTEVLLDVPKYDFNWQLRYDLTQPKLLPQGTVVHTTAHFDNSEENLANPDPTAEVRFGDQTWEEMMFGFMTTLDPNQDLQKEPLSAESEDDAEATRLDDQAAVN